jgi:hypothetical protein
MRGSRQAGAPLAQAPCFGDGADATDVLWPLPTGRTMKLDNIH